MTITDHPSGRKMRNASFEIQGKLATQDQNAPRVSHFRFSSCGFLCISKLAFCVSLAVLATGCFMVGPDYQRPDAAISESWLEADNARLRRSDDDLAVWWSVFDDPVLDQLVETAFAQNLTLRTAGLRVIEAQARRGIAISTLFPQQQGAIGSYTRVELSENRANQGNPGLDDTFDDWQVGFDAAWELDVWGRFRRGIETADAALLASVADYDDVLVSLISEVALTYVQLRTLEERLAVAVRNTGVQNRSFEIAGAKFDNGLVTELDVAQSQSLLLSTQSTIPVLEAQIRQAQNNLCFLLGVPPRDLTDMLGSAPIPSAPETVVVGVPAELLRRRPDIRRIERLAAAQSAQIGVAVSDFYPRLSLVGTISLGAEDFKDLFEGDSFEAFGGPTFRWAILNYGRIRNNVRVQDAFFQQLVTDYENTVLRAQREAEDAIAGFLRALEQVELLEQSVTASERAVDLSNLQYREGTVDYVRVLNAQEFQATQEDALAAARGSVALNLIALYKALGGGWQLRAGSSFVDEDTREQMRQRTSWGGMLDDATDVETAESGTEKDTGWWRWKWWWPRW